MSGTAPTVSVVVPVYNAAATLADTIESVLSQTIRDWELLLVDDASFDDSAALAAAYASKDARIRLLKNEQNLGVAQTRNRGILAARGTFVALLDSDDLWLPDKLERQLSLAEATGGELIYCSYAVADETGRPCCADFIVPETTDLYQMLVRSVISCSTAMIRRDLLQDHPFRSDYAHEDLVLWLELMKSGCRAFGCPEVLATYRLSEGSRSGDKRKAAAGRWRVYRDYMGLSFFQSARLFFRYALLGMKKYKRSGR